MGANFDMTDNHDENLQWSRMEICFYYFLAHAYQMRRDHLA